MDNIQISEFIGYSQMSIVDVMQRIDSNAKGILFIVDEQKRLKGCVTDGDIRRWLIKTGNLDTEIEPVMMHHPKYLYTEERFEAEEQMTRRKLTAIPILNKRHQIEDIIFSSESAHKTIIDHDKSLSDVPVVIMAGGKGTRLYPYTRILPKPLIPVGDTPIVERIIDRFTDYGVQLFYMTVNYKKSMIKSYFTDLNPDYDIVYVEEEKPLGTAGSIKYIRDRLTMPVLITNSDSLILTDYSDLYQYHSESQNEITIVSAVKNITVPYGVLQSGENGELIGMEEKPRLSYFINTGMYVVNPEAIDLIPEDSVFHMTDLVTAVMKKGGKVGSYPVSEDSFLDMGEFGEMRRMEEKLGIINS